MKKSLLSLACCCALSPLAHAQTAAVPALPNFTIYGKIDIGQRHEINASTSEIAPSGDSRLGLKGSENLGNGNRAFFNLEHRFLPQNGQTDGSAFWKGIANAGIATDYGQLALGRQYVAAFSLIQNQIDPFGGDTVAQLRDVGLRVAGIGKTRIDSSTRYDYSANGLNFAVSTAKAAANNGSNNPFSAALNYKSGDLFVGIGFEDPAGLNDRISTVGAAWTLSGVTLSAGMSQGRTDADIKAKGYMVGLNWPLGKGELKAALGSRQVDDVTTGRKVGLGYHLPLSERTMIYVDVGHDSKAATHRSGYDVGFRHTF
jgi:predicted porin